MTPETQIWRDRLNSTVKRIDDIFEDALHNAQTALDNDGLKAWLAGADRVAALGATGIVGRPSGGVGGAMIAS